MDHDRERLKLNPNDNQAARDRLTVLPFKYGGFDELRALLAAYEADLDVRWIYTPVLISFRYGPAEHEPAFDLVWQAWRQNERVSAMLGGTEPLVLRFGPFVTLRNANEAALDVERFGPLWQQTGAIGCLTAFTADFPWRRRADPNADSLRDAVEVAQEASRWTAIAAAG